MRLTSLPANYQLLSKQARPTKVTHLAKPSSMTTMPAHLIVQSQGTKTVPTINVQHIQQVMKQPQHITVSWCLWSCGTSEGTLLY